MARETSDGFDVQPLSLRRTTDGVRNPIRTVMKNTSANARLGFQLNRAHRRLEATVLASDLESQYDAFSYNPVKPVDDLSRHNLRTVGLNWTAQWTEAFSTLLSLTDSNEHYETTPSIYLTETGYAATCFKTCCALAHIWPQSRWSAGKMSWTTPRWAPPAVATRMAWRLAWFCHKAATPCSSICGMTTTAGLVGKTPVAHPMVMLSHVRCVSPHRWERLFVHPPCTNVSATTVLAACSLETSRNVEAGFHYVDGTSRFGVVAYQ